MEFAQFSRFVFGHFTDFLSVGARIIGAVRTQLIIAYFFFHEYFRYWQNCNTESRPRISAFNKISITADVNMQKSGARRFPSEDETEKRKKCRKRSDIVIKT